MYESQLESTIRQRLLDACNSALNKNEGSFVWDVLSPVAVELAQFYIEMDRIITLGFSPTTYGTYLDMRAGEHGITRLPATKSTGQVTITGTNSALIPVGTVFATSAGIQFKTTAQGTIAGGTVTVSVESVEAGASGNVPYLTITTIPVAISGVTGVTNEIATTGGTDAESDEALLDRFLEKVQTPATSGNDAHFKQWAKEVAGVGDAKVFSLWAGNGTVKVVIIDSNKLPASGGLITNVSNYIETTRPVGATVTVVSATGVNIDIGATIQLSGGYLLANVKSAFETKLTDYLKTVAFSVSNYVSYAQIGAMLLDTPGIIDYTALTINTATDGITLGDTEVPVKGTVTFA